MATRICKGCNSEFNTRYQNLYCNACKPLEKANKGGKQGMKEKVYLNCVNCDFRFLGWPQSKYCSPKCKPSLNHSCHRERSIKNLKNTLKDDCTHFFPRNKHEVKKETLTFTCSECKGKMEIFKKPYNIERPERV